FGRAHGQTKRSALVRVHRELLHKPSFHRKLDDLAGLIWVGIDTVVIRDQQMAIRSHGHRKRTVQMDIVLVNDGAETSITMTGSGIPYGENRVVARRGNIQHVAPPVVHQPGWR